MGKEKDYKSAAGTILWMIITAVVVFLVTSFQYTKMSLGNEVYDYYSDVSSSGDYDFDKLKKVLEIIDKEYLYSYDLEKIEDGAISGMLDALGDPYTAYYNVENTKNFLVETEGEYEGIGIYLTMDTEYELPIVLAVFKNSPAAEAGVLPGDYILEIEGESTKDKLLEEISTKVKGRPNTKVKIKFGRYDDNENYEEIEKEITRKKIETNYFEDKILENNIGYISFEAFDEHAEEHFNDAYNKLVNKNEVEGLIIDLRNNSGGIVDVADAIVDKIVPLGNITYIVDKEGNKEYINSDSECIKIPLVVLINENSASAAEIMAAAVQDHSVGEIVGTTSYGKGLVQKFKSLGDGTYVKITISEYFSPNGKKINGVGVVPDVIVEDDKNTEEDEQLLKAIEIINQM